MADKEYRIVFVVENADALAKLNQMEAAYNRVAAAAMKAKAATGGVVTTQTISAMDTMNKRISSTSARLGNLQKKAGAASSALIGVGTSAGGIGGSLGNASTHASSLNTSLGSMVAAGLALRGATKIIGEFGEAIREARAFDEKTAEGNLANKDKGRELASLMGESGPNDRVMGRIFSTGLATGMNFDEANEFLKQFEGSVPAGEQKKHIQKEQYGEVAAEAGRATLKLGLDTKTGGDLAGVIPMLIDINKQKDASGKTMSAREATAAQFGMLGDTLNEGRGAVSTLMRNMLAAAIPSIQAGRAGGTAEVGAMISVLSTATKGPARTGTAYAQLDRLLNETDPKKGGKMLQEAGVADVKGNYEKIVKLKEHIDKVKPDDVNKYLEDAGFGNSTDRLVATAALGGVDLMKIRVAKAKEKAKMGKEYVAANDEFMKSEDMQNRLATVRVESAEHEHGKRNAKLMIARKNAIAELVDEGTLNASDQLFADSVKSGFGAAQFFGAPEAQKTRVDERVRRNVEREIGNKGMSLEDLEKKGLAYRDLDGNLHARVKDGALDQLAAEGVDVFGGAASGVGVKARMDGRDPMKAAAAAKARMPQAGGLIRPAAGGEDIGKIDNGPLMEAGALLKQAAMMFLGGAPGAAASAGVRRMVGPGPEPAALTPAVMPRRN